MKIFLTKAENIPADSLLPYLSAQRKDKVKKIKDPLCATVCAQAELLLAYALGKRDALDLEYGFSGNGKPYLLEYKKDCFNLSHSEDFILLGICEHKIGVDIQKRQHFCENTAKRFFPPAFLDFLQASENRQDTFFSLWCAKESLVKCLSLTFADRLSGFSFEFSDKRIVCKNGKNILYISLYQKEDFFFAVCSDEIFDFENMQTVTLSEHFSL